MNLEIVNWVKDGKYRIRVLEALGSQPLLSSELADRLGINRASMSRILSDMKAKRLVLSVSGNSRTVTYSLTLRGKELLAEVKGGKCLRT